MKISIFGTGYIGLVTGACLASIGHQVCCVDVDKQKIARLCQGNVDIYEPGLPELVAENITEQRLTFSADPKAGIEHADVIFIAVGTPPKEDGTADLAYVLSCAKQIAVYIKSGTIVVNKSTVPVGTVERINDEITQQLIKLERQDIHFDVCSNPEFLKEGAAVEDFRRPDRIIIGTDSERVKTVMSSLYSAFSRHHKKLMFMAPRSAELTKYAANAMLATKISFINEISNIAEHVGADIEDIRQGIGADQRIGYHFIYAGSGYGGSCFPKDVKALSSIANKSGCEGKLLKAVDDVNEKQKRRLLHHIDKHFDNDIAGKRIAVWGLAFKPQTNDVREATSQVIISGLIERGANVIAYDPHANMTFEQYYGEHLNIQYSDHMMDALQDADALVICTEWRQFRSPDFAQLKDKMRSSTIFDGRNIYEPTEMAEKGISYYGIGRGLSVSRL